MGLLTDVTVRITPLPEHEEFHAIFFPDFVDGMTAVRRIVQGQLPLSLLRLSTPTETRTTLALAGHERLIGLLETMLGIRGVGDEKCMLLCGFTGTAAVVRDARHATIDIAKEHQQREVLPAVVWRAVDGGSASARPICATLYGILATRSIRWRRLRPGNGYRV